MLSINELIKLNIREDEEVLLVEKTSVIIFILPILIGLFSFVFLFYKEYLGFLLSILSSVLLLFSCYLLYQNTFFAITDKKVLIKFGIFNRVIEDIPINRLGSISIKQDFIGVIFNYGNVYLSDFSGNTGKTYIINNPMNFKKQLNSLTNY